MSLKVVTKIFFLFACQLFLIGYKNELAAQGIQYSNKNVFIGYPDLLQLQTNVAGNHHLLSFINKEKPVIFIFNQDLEFKTKITLPFKLPDRSAIRIIPFSNFYYLYIHLQLSQKDLLWKVDGNGNLTDFTAPFQKLLQSQLRNYKSGFQLIANQEELWLVYHVPLTDPQKNTLIVVQTDSLLNVVLAHKVIYTFKRDEEQLKKEVLMFGKFLFILKTAKSNTSLELMKIDLATGYTNTQTFQSSGYFYSQAAFNYNTADSTVTISSLLTEPRTSGWPKQFVFLSRLNNSLLEQVPFAILKSQFSKKTNTNFLLGEGLSKWMRLKQQMFTSNLDFGMPDPNNSAEAKTSWERYTTTSDDGVRFSLLNENFEIISDSLVANTKNSYTLNANEFTSFGVGNKEYLLLGQQFSKKSRGLLMISANHKHQLVYTDIRVNDRNDYLLAKSRFVPKNGIVIPYVNGKEAGLVKITVE